MRFFKNPRSGCGATGSAASPTVHKTNTENSKQIFPEKELRGHSPNLHIHVSVRDLYIPTIDLPILLQEICGPILGIYKSLINTWMRNWDWDRAFPGKGIHKWDFCCSAPPHTLLRQALNDDVTVYSAKNIIFMHVMYLWKQQLQLKRVLMSTIFTPARMKSLMKRKEENLN